MRRMPTLGRSPHFLPRCSEQDSERESQHILQLANAMPNMVIRIRHNTKKAVSLSAGPLSVAYAACKPLSVPHWSTPPHLHALIYNAKWSIASILWLIGKTGSGNGRLKVCGKYVCVCVAMWFIFHGGKEGIHKEMHHSHHIRVLIYSCLFEFFFHVVKKMMIFS